MDKIKAAVAADYKPFFQITTCMGMPVAHASMIQPMAVLT